MPANPTVQRRILASRLRSLREASGLTIEEVAARLLCSPSKISRLETGARRATLGDVRDLALLYQTSAPETGELMTLVREASQRDWWDAYGEVARRAGGFLALEEA